MRVLHCGDILRKHGTFRCDQLLCGRSIFWCGSIAVHELYGGFFFEFDRCFKLRALHCGVILRKHRTFSSDCLLCGRNVFCGGGI